MVFSSVAYSVTVIAQSNFSLMQPTHMFCAREFLYGLINATNIFQFYSTLVSRLPPKTPENPRVVTNSVMSSPPSSPVGPSMSMRYFVNITLQAEEEEVVVKWKWW